MQEEEEPQEEALPPAPFAASDSHLNRNSDIVTHELGDTYRIRNADPVGNPDRIRNTDPVGHADPVGHSDRIGNADSVCYTDDQRDSVTVADRGN